MADVDALSLKELKALIAKAGLSSADCLDKEDLRARARQASEKLASGGGEASGSAPAPPPTPSGGSDERTMGGYPCIVKGPADLISGAGGGAPADMVIVTLHGLGATNLDLADLGTMVTQLEPSIGAARVVQIYPQAPQTPIGTAWWTFDVVSFMQAAMTGDSTLLGQLIRKKPPGIDECRANFVKLLEEARLLAGGGSAPLPPAKVLLAGFSLGSITALDTALHCAAGQGVAGVLFMHGAPICIEEWAERLKLHPGLRVFMTGGQKDMTLPPQTSGWVKQLLDANGAKADLHLHPGGHDLGGEDVMKRIARFVREMVDKVKATP